MNWHIVVSDGMLMFRRTCSGVGSEAGMPTVKERSRERRWVVLATDGRYVTLGRDTDPSEGEIVRVEDALHAQGLAGWLAVMEGNPYVGAVPRLFEVRPLAAPNIGFDAATAACVRAIGERRPSPGE